ncbi:hypothetical protein PMAYCL1PPCAC_27173 [Pristionchus mayeri]|uniref:Uncharacterized protein n=1 Tax=Pristionchus mayeri TaxID=1317129 RepID=A0AAN5D5M4_9BILA|nr:hypothetical protein PMAYCL1PPCAC_27173 [Pristionchus mayeri]
MVNSNSLLLSFHPLDRFDGRVRQIDGRLRDLPMARILRLHPFEGTVRKILVEESFPEGARKVEEKSVREEKISLVTELDYGNGTRVQRSDKGDWIIDLQLIKQPNLEIPWPSTEWT